MTIQEYLNEIKALKGNESEVVPELEGLLLKIASNGEDNYFTIDALFQKSNVEIFVLNTEMISKIVKQTNLLFSDQNEEGNVCFANNSEMRSEFRQSFTIIDLLDFSYAVLHSSQLELNVSNENQRIPIPSDVGFFWKLVKIGNKIRDNH